MKKVLHAIDIILTWRSSQGRQTIPVYCATVIFSFFPVPPRCSHAPPTSGPPLAAAVPVASPLCHGGRGLAARDRSQHRHCLLHSRSVGKEGKADWLDVLFLSVRMLVILMMLVV